REELVGLAAIAARFDQIGRQHVVESRLERLEEGAALRIESVEVPEELVRGSKLPERPPLVLVRLGREVEEQVLLAGKRDGANIADQRREWAEAKLRLGQRRGQGSVLGRALRSNLGGENRHGQTSGAGIRRRRSSTSVLA